MAANAADVPLDPLYVVVFASTQRAGDPYEPIVRGRDPSAHKAATEPHALMREMIPALGSIWYVLHLPRWEGDLRVLAASLYVQAGRVEVSHRCMLVPFPMVQDPFFLELLRLATPTLFIAPRALRFEVEGLRAALAVPLPVAVAEELSQESLDAHWRAIAALMSTRSKELLAAPRFGSRLDDAPLRLPLAFLERLARAAGAEVTPAGASQDNAASLLQLKELIAIAAQDEEADADASPGSRPTLSGRGAPDVALAVSLLASGVPSHYRKIAYGRSKGTGLAEPSSGELELKSLDDPGDQVAERAASLLLATHQALGSSGAGVELAQVPDRCFDLLARLEDYCHSSVPDPKKVWRMLRRIGTESAALFTEDARALVDRASTLAVLSGFPLGLALLPGATAPLVCQLPVAQRPLLPLTRAIQRLAGRAPHVYLGDGFEILIAECVSEEESVIHGLGRVAWDLVREQLDTLPGVRCNLLQVDDAATLRRAFAETRYAAVILSAHGLYDAANNRAGILVGGSPLFGLELENVPPLVVLSSCQVSPRGRSVVSIADLLLRQGALAVLGTLVPVDVRHNAILMIRLFVYVCEALQGRQPFRSIDQAWHHVLASNALNDVLGASKAVEDWARTARPNGRNLFEEFMMHRSKSRLRLAHIYQDTVALLTEIAEETGFGETFSSTIRAQSFLPESLFYTFVGWPDRILLQDEALRRSQDPRERGRER